MSELEKVEVGCFNCKYEKILSYEIPCYSCGKGVYSKWEPKDDNRLKKAEISRLLRIVSWTCPTCNEHIVIGGCSGCIHNEFKFPYTKGSKCYECDGIHRNWEGPGNWFSEHINKPKYNRRYGRRFA